MKLRRPFTKMVIDARKTVGLTQEEAAELLGVSTNTLQKYEQGDIRIHDDMATRMAMVYHDPLLKRMYCENECAIGQQDGHFDCDRSPEALMLDLLLLDPHELKGVVRTLRDIMADGGGDMRSADKNRCIAFLDRWGKEFEALKLHVQRMDS